MKPTPEQQKVIEHATGHGLVFAVAGSGKTATMIERVLHLIRHQSVRPERIMACTFSREATRVIEHRLAQYPEATGVLVCTLHSLAARIIREASRMGVARYPAGEDKFSYRLFITARNQLIEENPEHRSTYYNIKYDDFQTYISIQKGNLALPYIPDDLPDWAKDMISMPVHGIELYVRLYERHDELRRAEDLADFDDIIVLAWQLMARFPHLADVMQSKWDYIHVDEFQDVNLAQSEMLDLLSQKCRSYLAIGDDDQTVYQWRGANPRYILEFPKRYNAQEFTLSTNFRCPMGVISLAGAMISQNQIRAPKRMKASREGNGVYVHSHESGTGAKVAISLLDEGYSPKDIVILIRTFAQTGEIERVFIEKGIPYLIVGSVPFYERQEVKILLSYLRLAMADLDTQRQVPVSATQQRQLLQDWQAVANVPNRYLRKDIVQNLSRGLWQWGRTLLSALTQYVNQTSGNQQKEMLKFIAAFSDLTDNLALSQGKESLLEFTDAIDYAGHLVKTAPTREFGEERAGSIRALAEMAAERSLGGLLDYIARLSQQGRFVERLSSAENDEVERVTIMTAFRAKGLEWPIVIVPGCNEGLYRIKESADRAAAEEERRVFYVAMTRAQQQLHLVVDENEPTRFLTDIHHTEIIYDHSHLTRLMSRDPAQWSGRETMNAAKLLQKYQHEHFVQNWLNAGYRERLLQRFQSLGEQLLVRMPSGHEIVKRHLGLERYKQEGELPLERGHDIHDFRDLDSLAQDLSGQYEREQVAARAKAQTFQTGSLPRQTGTSVHPDEVFVGLMVTHQKFGTGTVINVKGMGEQKEAEIDFPILGKTKRMMVIYANLSHIPQPACWQDDDFPEEKRPFLEQTQRYTSPTQGSYSQQSWGLGKDSWPEEEDDLPF